MFASPYKRAVINIPSVKLGEIKHPQQDPPLQFSYNIFVDYIFIFLLEVVLRHESNQVQNRRLHVYRFEALQNLHSAAAVNAVGR